MATHLFPTVSPAVSCGAVATWNVAKPLLAWVSPSGHQQPLNCALHSGTSNPVSPSLGTLGCTGVSPGCVPFLGGVPRPCSPCLCSAGGQEQLGVPEPQ